MAISATQLRNEIYRILDQVLETGIPVEIERRGRRLKIVPDVPKSRLDRLIKRDCIVGNPEDLVEVDWSGEWRPEP